MQIGNPFIRKFIDLKHQENFSKGTTQDKISVRHPAEGCAEGTGEVPFAGFSSPKEKKAHRDYLYVEKTYVKITKFFLHIISIL